MQPSLNALYPATPPRVSPLALSVKCIYIFFRNVGPGKHHETRKATRTSTVKLILQKITC